MMEFEFRIPKSARLRTHISQRSNLKYVKTVMDHFDERHREDFRNSSLGYMVDVPDIQFSVQLIQQLVFRTIRTDKLYELWFSVQGHLMRFSLHEYALVTGLRCGAFPEGAEFDQLLERRRLKESSTPRADRYKLGLVLILEGVFNAPDNNVGIHLPTLSIVDDLELFFAYPWGRVWAYETLPEVGKRFVEQVGERLPQLCWSARKQPQHRTYDAFFKNVKLHVYTILWPTDAKAQQPYFLTLVPYDEPPISILDDIARTAVASQFNASGGDGRDGGHATREDFEDEASKGGRSEEQTSGGDDEKGTSGSDPDGEDSEDTGESHGEGSSAGEDTRGGARGTSSSPRPPRDPSPDRWSTTQARALGTLHPA
ncbi:Hypothetical predicted protein [Olea europaea subsp. europaea]|uniref:DUF1985 domain-containing protein n=1 Tax=Olea europaea subsp. europaea TaxID=158383 RepID=A0A8S0SMT4_OLEEU|nr:Hypothetical predicted protein [Olea europaea subsp. europaea]